jgi:Icc-related predicted phosphoesterase
MPFWNKKPKTERVRIFFTTDLHGSEPTFRKFVNAAKYYQVEHLIMGGDVTGKFLIPIVDEGNQTYKTTLQATPYVLHGQEELNEFEKRLGKLGCYSIVVGSAAYRRLLDDPAEQHKVYIEKAKERLSAWVRLAEEKLSGSNVRCYLTGGNDDAVEVLECLYREAQEHVIPCEDKVVPIGEEGHTMVSFGYSNLTPWDTPRELGEDELRRLISQKVAGIEDFSRGIFNFHVPPVDSNLDTCPRLDTSTNPPTVITSGGEPVMFGAGSLAVREAIEKYQPLLGLHGHIHESRGVVKIGRTVAINPGSEYGEGILRGIIISLKDLEVESTQMTSG